jgi:putative Mg2+ transporter-C (MgtC) family protein
MLGDLQHYWSGDFLAANAFIGLNLVGALLLGMLVGYERSYNGRAAGMRTYGLVCMASTALTVFVGHASLWYGGAAGQFPADPTRVVQGVVTGIGFLCAGVIMRDGLSISGLTTAASIWAAAAIGVLLGVGFYPASLLLALLCMASMSLLHRLEAKLPGRSTLEVRVKFGAAGPPTFDDLAERAEARGYRVLGDSLRITFSKRQPVWRFCVVALDRARAASPALLAHEMAVSDGVASFSIVPVRN